VQSVFDPVTGQTWTPVLNPTGPSGGSPLIPVTGGGIAGMSQDQINQAVGQGVADANAASPGGAIAGTVIPASTTGTTGTTAAPASTTTTTGWLNSLVINGACILVGAGMIFLGVAGGVFNTSAPATVVNVLRRSPK
jgi:hypothetical protein